MKRCQFTLQRERDIHIHTYRWQQIHEIPPKAIIQLAHGMAEHILRYDDFSRYLVEQGFIVYGNDHRGHGRSIMGPDDRGYFADENGFEKIVADMRAVTSHIQHEHPRLPVILFGHSMGSFAVRRYIQLHGGDLAGVILSGTGGDKGLLGKMALFIAKWEVKRKGARTPSPLMDQLIFGKFNKAFKPARTSFDFLTRDKSIIDAYVEDEKCGFICSASMFVDLMEGIERIHKTTELEKTPKTLPIYLIAGDKDPVGNNGKDIIKVRQLYKEHGQRNVQYKLYPGARHEIINEINKEEVYNDIKTWLNTIL